MNCSSFVEGRFRCKIHDSDFFSEKGSNLIMRSFFPIFIIILNSILLGESSHRYWISKRLEYIGFFFDISDSTVHLKAVNLTIQPYDFSFLGLEVALKLINLFVQGFDHVIPKFNFH